ncbi:uncharacterized protein [Procambarus clarkii]|uniref:uncharacterized protein n=1 Tax=Procambarus clarkii TaxID=6728 RepID=UPI0037431FE3
MTKITEALEEKQNTDVVYRDFSKVFDKCDHGVIAHKMRSIGITDKRTSNSFVSSYADDTKISMKISSVKDTEKLQADINRVFDWATENNMIFNGDKLQVLRYGGNEEVKRNTGYRTQSDPLTIRKRNM